jgi:hypothetical protein
MIRRKAVIVGLAAGAAALIAIPAAFAAAGTTYTIKAGSKTSGSEAYKAKTDKIIFTDTTTKTPLQCSAGTASGDLSLGKKVAASKAATITKTTWTDCAGPGGLTLVPVQKGTWKLNASGKTSSGVTKVFVSNVTANVHAKGSPNLCKFTVTGSADGTFTNSSNNLTLKPGSHKLKTSKVTGCLGQINNGDTVTFKATYKLAATDGTVSVKSN